MVWDRQCLKYSEQKDDSMNQSVNDKGVCRTALASPGLLKTIDFKNMYQAVTGAWHLSKQNSSANLGGAITNKCLCPKLLIFGFFLENYNVFYI